MNLLRKPLPYRFFNATLLIIAANLLVYFLGMNMPRLNYLLMMTPSAVLENGAWWQVFTYMYVHGDFSHILFNMLALFFVGVGVEQRMGSVEFLIFYHLVGALAGLFSLGFYYLTFQWTVALLGASGAIFGVFLAFAAYTPNTRFLLFFIIPLRATSLVIIYTAYDLFSQILNPDSGVAHLTHLAGFVFAYLYMLIRIGINAIPRFIYPERYGD